MTTMTVIGRLTNEQYISVTNLRQERETIRQDNRSIMTNFGGTEERVKVFRERVQDCESDSERKRARKEQKNKVNHYSLIKNVHSNFIYIYNMHILYNIYIYIYIYCIYII